MRYNKLQSVSQSDVKFHTFIAHSYKHKSKASIGILLCLAVAELTVFVE